MSNTGNIHIKKIACAEQVVAQPNKQRGPDVASIASRIACKVQKTH